jgi:hypothetical protein
MNWDCNPKQRFTRNHLEKCYTTSKNNRPVEKLPEKGGPMGYKKGHVRNHIGTSGGQVG